MRVLVVALCLVGCGPSGAAPAAKTTVAAAGEPASSAAIASQRQGGVAIEPYSAAAPAITIAKPLEDESLPAEAARTQPVIVDDGGYLDENPGSRIALLLDGEVVREVSDVRAPLTLGAVDIHGLDPSPGEHLLAAVAVGPRGEAIRSSADHRVSVAVRRFFVGPPAKSAGVLGPVLLFLAPRGTYNGKVRAKSALLDFAILGGELGVGGLALRVRISGPLGESDTVLSGPGPYALRGLDSGDHRVDVELRKSEGPLSSPWSRASRTITVNLDGPAR